MATPRSAAEAGPAPDCACHGKRMYWNRRADLRAGGYWRCAVANLASNKAWRDANVEYRKVKLREWHAANRDRQRIYQRQWRYGISAAAFDAVLAAQGNRCALCDEEFSDSRKMNLHVDHDHSNGHVRGLLCLRCNTAIERAEIPGWLERARVYLS